MRLDEIGTFSINVKKLGLKSLVELNLTKEIRGGMDCRDNQLINLVGGPQTVGQYYAADHNHISSLQGFPRHVGTVFHLANNNLTNLKGIHKIVKYIGNRLDVTENPIASHILGVLLIDGLYEFNIDHPSSLERIVNENLCDRGDKHARMLRCQDQLIDAGLEEFARL